MRLKKTVNSSRLLNEDVWLKVIKYLNLIEVITMFGVSRHLRRLASDSTVWRALLRHHFPHAPMPLPRPSFSTFQQIFRNEHDKYATPWTQLFLVKYHHVATVQAKIKYSDLLVRKPLEEEKNLPLPVSPFVMVATTQTRRDELYKIALSGAQCDKLPDPTSPHFAPLLFLACACNQPNELAHEPQQNLISTSDFFPIEVATLHHSLDVLSVIRQKGVSFDLGRRGFPPLFIAVYYRVIPVIESLLAGSIDINLQHFFACSEIYTPLSLAASLGYEEIVRMLLERGALVQYTLSTSRFGSVQLSPLHRAAASGHLKIVELFLNIGANIDFPDDAGNTAFSLALQRKHFDVCRYLLKRGATIPTVLLNDLDHLFNWIVEKQDREVIAILLGAGVGVNRAANVLRPS